MENIQNMLSGKKTYIVAVAMIVYALLGQYIGKELDVNLILEALAIAGLRAGISK